MDVKGGVARPAHAMAEGHPDEPLAALDPGPALSALDEAGFMLEVGEALSHRLAQDGEDAGAGCLIAKGVEDRNRLRRAESDVVAEDRLDPLFGAVGTLAVAGVGAPEELGAADRIGALEDRGVCLGVYLAGEAELGGQLADPLARRLAGLGVVVLAAFGDGGEPVAGVASLNLRDPDHVEGSSDGEGSAPPEVGRTPVRVHNVSGVGVGVAERPGETRFVGLSEARAARCLKF